MGGTTGEAFEWFEQEGDVLNGTYQHTSHQNLLYW